MESHRFMLVAVETAHIQPYIFASNRLKENIGASYLVAIATEGWAYDCLHELSIRTNLTDDPANPFSDHLTIESGAIDAEVLYSGGGNLVLLVAESDDVLSDASHEQLPVSSLTRQFIRSLSRRVIAEAPGLALVFNVKPFTWDKSLSEAVGDLLGTMKHKAGIQPTLYGESGLSVQLVDVSNGMPAVMLDKDPDNRWQPYGAETNAKREAALQANTFLERSLELDADYCFPLNLDDLGRSKDDTSYMAVVHADGNGLGRLVQGLKDEYTAGRNREYIRHMRRFSQAVKDIASAAQKAMIEQLLETAKLSKDRRTLSAVGRKTESIRLKTSQDGRITLPFRPLVSGGDDVTFVCDGRIALDLAVTFVTAFAHYSQKLLGNALTACAGVAIVKSHYPFARAYDLAEQLAKSAKQARLLRDPVNAPGAIDWFITTGGLYDDLDQMRVREYKVGEGCLSLRPVFVQQPETDDPDFYHTWKVVQRMVTEFQTRWDKHQNKAMGLREVLRKGSLETAVFKLRYLTTSSERWSPGLPPYLPEVGEFAENGWHNGVCGYFDALELVDKYIPLKNLELKEMA